MSDTKALQPPYLPRHVADIQIAFPAQVSHLMPEWNWDIDAQWRRGPNSACWIQFQQDWFFGKVDMTTLRVRLKAGIDGEAAFRHLAVIQRSFEPKHEAKEYAVSKLASEWFDQIADAEGRVLYGTEETRP